jgi:hypothetical protein
VSQPNSHKSQLTYCLHRFHNGKNSSGNNFGQACGPGGWKLLVEKPFVDHLHKCFRESFKISHGRKITSILALSVRQSRAIPGTYESSAQDGDIRPFLNLKTTAEGGSKASPGSPQVIVVGDDDESISGSEPGAVEKSLDGRSEYEIEREENIARNKIIFSQLANEYSGLFDDCKKSTKGQKGARKSTTKLRRTPTPTALSGPT